MQRLFRDDSGMIMVIAIPMGALLVGMLWYLATVGDGVLFRERLQDAADATAFENAVLHARGMNVVATMNILMSLLLCIVVALRAAEIVLAAGLIFFGITAGALADVIDLDVEISPRIGKAIAIMNKIEKGVAAATPVMASVLASGGNTTFYRQHEAASGSLGVSYALFPTLLDQKSQVDPRDRAQLRLGGGGGNPRMGAALLGRAGKAMPSLPVEDGKYEDLCARAIVFGPTQVVSIAGGFGKLKGAMGKISHFIGKFRHLLTKSGVASVFCLTGEGSLEAVTQQACDDSELPSDPPKDKDASTSSGAYGSDPNRTKNSDAAKQAMNECTGHFARQSGDSASKDEQMPAQMWGRAQNGNVIMQTWSFAVGSPKYEAADRRGMSFASPRNPSSFTMDKLATAQAEYYFACSSGWNGCKEDATWVIGWTARMRRFWWPLGALQKASNAFYEFEQAFSLAQGFLERGIGDVHMGTSAGQLGEDADAVLRAQHLFQSLSGPRPKMVH